MAGTIWGFSLVRKTTQVRNYREGITDMTLPIMRCEAERNFSKLSVIKNKVHFRWRPWKFLIKLSMHLLFDPEIPLLGIHSSKMKTCVYQKTWVRMFMAAFFITATNWKQLRCPSAREWINKLWCIYTKECFSVLRGNTSLMQTTMWINLINILSEKKPDAKENILCDLLFIALWTGEVHLW